PACARPRGPAARRRPRAPPPRAARDPARVLSRAPRGARRAVTSRSGERPAAVETHELSREYSGQTVVDSVSFRVEAGQITGLIGPNGAGKSTVLAMIAGALKPTAGSVLYEGRDVTGQPTYRLARRGLVRTLPLGGNFP